MDFNEEEELQEEQAEFEKLAFEGETKEETNHNEEINENEPIEKSDSSDSETNESPIEHAKGQMKKNVLAALIKSPLFWGGIGAIVFIFLGVLIFHMGYDLFGTGIPKPKYYQTPSCGKVFLTWEKESYTKKHSKDEDYQPITDASLVDLSNEERFEYKEYDYDNYIAGVIWTDNHNALDVDNEVVYQAMAIAARSYLFAGLPDNCVVLKNYNEQAARFTELEGDEEKYEEIMEAVKLSKGMIIGRNNQIISAKYDAFSYTKKRMEEEESYNKKYFYHMMNENEEKELIIPAEWVDEISEERGLEFRTNVIKHVAATKKLESMSLYGAKYLLEQVDSLYDLYRVLETFYGRDIEYYTIDSSFSISGGGFFGTSGCMWWPVGSLETTVENGITYAKGLPSATTISSPFGNRNLSLANATKYHQAIDISGGGKDNYHNIIAAADGEVIATNTGCVAGYPDCGGRLGNYVRIQHSDGTITRYAHLYSVSVSVGSSVKQGQVIGKMGNTGNSTGVHLDFQILVNGTAVNPIDYVSVSSARIQCIISSGTVSGNSNSQSICLTLKSKGYSASAIAGIMANLEAESGFNPLAVNTSSGASGIAQWLGGRLTNLKNTYGTSWNTLDAQINFMLNELNSGYSRVNFYLRESHSASEMAQYVCTYYETPAKTIEAAAEVCRNSSRPTNANNTWLGYASNNCR